MVCVYICDCMLLKDAHFYFELWVRVALLVYLHRPHCLRVVRFLCLVVFVALRYLLDVWIACDFLALYDWGKSVALRFVCCLCYSLLSIMRSILEYTSSLSMWWWHGNGGTCDARLSDGRFNNGWAVLLRFLFIFFILPKQLPIRTVNAKNILRYSCSHMRTMALASRKMYMYGCINAKLIYWK